MALASSTTSSGGRSLSSEQLAPGGRGLGLGLVPGEDPRVLAVLTARRSHRCTLHPNDQLALEGPLSRVKSLKKSLRQSFRRIRRSRVSSRKQRPAGPQGEVRPSEASREPTQSPGRRQRPAPPSSLPALVTSTGSGPPVDPPPAPLPTSCVAQMCHTASLCFGVPGRKRQSS